MQERAMRSPWIAHRREADGALQSLENHLLAVARLSAGNASKLKFSMDDGACPAGLDGAGEVLGLLHDLGKYSQAFQDYLGSAVGLIDQDADDFVDAKQLRGRIDLKMRGSKRLHAADAQLADAVAQFDQPQPQTSVPQFNPAKFVSRPVCHRPIPMKMGKGKQRVYQIKVVNYLPRAHPAANLC